MIFECFRTFDHQPGMFMDEDVIKRLDRVSTKHAVASLIEVLTEKGLLTVDDLNVILPARDCRITKVITDR